MSAPTYTKPTDYAALARASGRRWGVDPSVLLGLVQIESGGDPTAVSSAGARGSTQFMPTEARRYGVVFGTSPSAVRSQVEGAAHYLHDLGYITDPVKALASYNAGPGNWQAGVGYAHQVMAAAGAYGGVDGSTAPTSTATSASTTASTSPSTGSSSSGGHAALGVLLWIALAATGAGLLVVGFSRTAGLRRQPA